MQPLLKFIKPLSILVLTLLLILAAPSFTPAQDTAFLESRVTRLESENTSLRSRISRLESTISQLSADAGIEFVPPEDGAAAVPSNLAEDPVFERLATLVIELRERIIVVENRISELDAGVAPP